MMRWGQLRHEEILAIRVLWAAYGGDVVDSLLHVRGITTFSLVHNGFDRAGEVPRLETIRIRARLRMLRSGGGSDPLQQSARHLLEPLFAALEREDDPQRPHWIRDDSDTDAAHDLIDVLLVVLERHGADVLARGVLRQVRSVLAAIGVLDEPNYARLQ